MSFFNWFNWVNSFFFFYTFPFPQAKKVPIIKHLFGKENGSLNRTIKTTPAQKKMFYIPFSKILTRNKRNIRNFVLFSRIKTETSSVSGKMQQTKSKLTWHWFVLARAGAGAGVRFVFTTKHNTDWKQRRLEIPTPTLPPLYGLRIQIRTENTPSHH